MRIPLLAPEKTIFPGHFVEMDLDLYHCPDDLVPVSGFFTRRLAVSFSRMD
jgi:hypothetical protein